MSPRCSLSLVPLVALAACTGDDGARATPALPPPPTAVAPIVDAGAPIVDVGVAPLPTFDPATGYHLDDGPVTRPAGQMPPRERKVGQILLRSSPSGALAAVDGVRMGPTPVLWEGLLDGQAREFTFVMAGHALARYRFVPVTSGVVHGTLVKLTDDKDAGVPEIPAVPAPATTVAVPPPRPVPRPPAPVVDAAPLPDTTDAPPPMPLPDAGAHVVGPPP